MSSISGIPILRNYNNSFILFRAGKRAETGSALFRYLLIISQFCLFGKGGGENDIEHEGHDYAVHRADEERRVQERHGLVEPGETGKGAAGDAGNERAHKEGDKARGRDALAEVEIFLFALAGYPVGGDDDSRPAAG